MNSIDIIKNYLEGSLSPQDFQKELYNNKDIENLLSEETQIPPYTNSQNAFLYLIGIDILLPSGEVNSKGLLSKLLTKKNVSFSLNNEYKKKYDLFMKIQPRWLNLTESYNLSLINIKIRLALS